MQRRQGDAVGSSPCLPVQSPEAQPADQEIDWTTSWSDGRIRPVSYALARTIETSESCGYVVIGGRGRSTREGIRLGFAGDGACGSYPGGFDSHPGAP
jgi:hypothetical protein